MYRDDLIRAEMAAQRLTEQVIAERTGLTRPYVNQLRNGKVPDPQLSTLERLAKALNISVAELVEPKKEKARVA